jgi:hypothetical protein
VVVPVERSQILNSPSQEHDNANTESDESTTSWTK